MMTNAFWAILGGFNSRAPRGARLRQWNDAALKEQFQFTRSSRSATATKAWTAAQWLWFQFTRSSRSATGEVRRLGQRAAVSIHALLAERDKRRRSGAHHVASFNSRAPRGARLDVTFTASLLNRFNSRAPRGARRRRCPPQRAGSMFQFTRSSRSATRRRKGADGR